MIFGGGSKAKVLSDSAVWDIKQGNIINASAILPARVYQ